MKDIVKKDEPKEFADWKAQANESWQPTYDDLAGNAKEAVKAALMAEQGMICCYCEQRLSKQNSHIEHFIPQKTRQHTLDYNNMLCSCQGQLRRGEPRHCGHLKDQWYDGDLLISPLDSGCEARFAFSFDGNIMPAADHDEAASETIKRLGLNIPKLIDMRAKVIEPFLDDHLSSDEVQTFVAGYLEKDAMGQFGEFWTTIHYLFVQSIGK